MRFVSFRHAGRDSFGMVSGDGLVDLVPHFGDRAASLRRLIAADLLAEAGEWAAGRAPDVALADLDFLPPLPDAGKVVAIGRNYRDHASEMAAAPPETPRFFVKLLSAFVGHGQKLVRPKISDAFDFEAELAVIIGRPGRYIAPEAAMSHVCGYTLLNDGSVRDVQKENVIAGKNFPASSSMGPYLVTADAIPDPAALTLLGRLNGAEMQRSSTGLMIFDIPTLIAGISRWTSLEPGDVIATGTPSGVGAGRTPPIWLRPGDRVEIEIEGLGTLSNPVVAED